MQSDPNQIVFSDNIPNNQVLAPVDPDQPAASEKAGPPWTAGAADDGVFGCSLGSSRCKLSTVPFRKPRAGAGVRDIGSPDLYPCAFAGSDFNVADIGSW